ncbi:CHASE2 domain-containing protein [Devosia riboflavina]|uniref:CHASE2 domain-containing protein n=1 Tax=Devosia riboflavina TaxID=46914 RepID=UPI00068DD031|nr:adenylate/guanylate cyclase domain-containing protein [Devosia riboflavina]
MGRRLAALTLGLLVILGLVALRLVDPYPVQVARETSFDVFQQLKPRTAPPDLPVRIIDIDEISMAEIGQWPWPRETLARLSERLTELGAAAIAFDILFSEAERSSGGPNPDEVFATSLKSGPTILGLAQNGSALPVTTPAKAGLATTGSDPLAAVPDLGGAAQPLPILAAAASGLGVASLDRQGAGVARRLPLLWRIDSGVIPTLSVEALRVAMGVPTLVVMGDNVDGRTVEAVRVGDFSIPTGPTGDLRLYYRELPPETYIPATDVLVSGPLVGLGVSLAVAAASVAFSWWSFSSPGLLIDPSYPLFAALVSYATMAFLRFTVTDFDRRRIRRAFGYYVEPSVLTQIEADQSLLRLGGNVRELTVMFSDVRNFSALAERTTPEQLVNILNGLFAALGGAIIRHRGTIDKFMGDSVMAFWNAPAEEREHALLAGRAALAMRAALRDLNRGSDDPIHIGIGIATGPALVGNMGFEKRFDYSCVGDTVNVASRIEGACKSVGYSILATSGMAAETPGLALLDAGQVELKGMSGREPVKLLVGDETLKSSPAFEELATLHAELVSALTRGVLDTNLLKRCEALAEKIEPELVQFYAALPTRLADFPPDEPDMPSGVRLRNEADASRGDVTAHQNFR